MRLLLSTLLVILVAQARSHAWSPYLDGGQISPLSYNWHVHIHPNGFNVNFSGILIDSQWVLTCAACINKAEAHTLYLGAHNLDDDTEVGRVKIAVTEDDVIIHPDYDSSSFNENNIALIKLPLVPDVSPYFDVIRLPTDLENTYDNVMARVTGFGFETAGATSGTQRLRFADLLIQADSNCRNLKEGQMCAEVQNGIGPCRDEGSALFITESDGKASVVGVFSYGYGEGGCPGERTLFTRVSTYADWINEEIASGAVTEPPPSTTERPPFFQDEYDEEEWK